MGASLALRQRQQRLEAEQYKGYAWPALIVTVLLMLGLLVWQKVSENGSQIPSAALPDQERLRHNRRDMLTRVRHDWIDDVLKQSLYEVARVDLGLEDRPDVVDRPLTLVVQEAAKPARLLPPRTKISSVFDAHSAAGGLLILGAPGAGKTTLLLELGEELLNRAAADESHLIPVVFNLSSWAVRRAPLADWLMDELNQRYDVPRKLAQQWVIIGEQVLPLLDGLDEVAGEHRDACVERINEFRSRYFLPMAVCSRSDKYQRLSGRLRLAAAVVVQPLTRAEVEEYRDRGGEAFEVLRTVVAGDPTLQEVLDTPLMLNIAMLAYRRVADHEALSGGTLQNGRRQFGEIFANVQIEREEWRKRRLDVQQPEKFGQVIHMEWRP